jgi:hypothetical protein
VKLVIPEKLRDRVKPRRSLPDFVIAPTEKGATRELARLAKKYVGKRHGDSSPKKVFAAGLDEGKDKALKTARREAHEFLLAPSLDEIRAMSLDALAVAERMAHDAAWDAHLVDAIAVTRGAADVVDVMVRGLDLDLKSSNFTVCVSVVRHTDGEPSRWMSDWTPVRHIVCAASDAEYAKAKKVAAAARKKLGAKKRDRLAYAFPDEPWAREEITKAKKIEEVDSDLFAACDDLELARKDLDGVPHNALDYALSLPEKDALALFAEALPPLLVRPKYGPLHKTPPRNIAEAIALFPNARAAKILAPYFGNAILGPIVAAYFQDHPELRDALGEKAKGRLHTETAATGPVAKDDDVPRVLRERPWKKPSASPKALMKLAIPKDAPERIELTAAEREKSFEKENADETFREMTKKELAEWRSELKKKDGYLHIDWNTIYRSRKPGVEYARVPEEEGLRAWNMGRGYANGTYVEWLARHGTKAIDGFLDRDWVRWLSYTEVDDEPMIDVLAHIVSPRIAPTMARVVARRKNFRRPAMAWLMKYPEIAATGLVPDALGKAGEERDDAELALRQMAQKGARDAILSAAKKYGDEAARGIETLVSRDPLEIDATVPKAPDFLRKKDLPPVVLKNGARLGDDAVDALVEMLRVAQLEFPPYAGITMLREACDEASLSAFARELAEQWLLAGANGRFEWMLFALGHFPSTENARRAGQLARDWARRDRKKAMRACIVLSAMGDDLALLHLGHVAATSRFDDLRDSARNLLDMAAALRGLSRDDLDDRIVPDLDLSDIAFGTRKLAVSLDEGLVPFIVGEKQFPRSKTADEKAAKARWDALKKDAAAIADRQIRRFEAAMVSGREWRVADFETYVAKHPLLRHLARRLVWSVQNATFRVAEDGTYANAKDAPVTLPADARVRIPHPASMKEDERAAWATLFADYKIAQPFEQLGRATGARVKRDAFKVKATKVLGTLESRGWRRNDRGHVTVYLRALRSGGDAKLPISPGISMEYIRDADDQTISGVELPQNASDPVDLAEITRDLDALM